MEINKINLSVDYVMESINVIFICLSKMVHLWPIMRVKIMSIHFMDNFIG